MKRRALHSLLVGAVVVVCLVGPVAALGLPGSPPSSHAAATPNATEQTASNPANHEIHIAVRPNGSGVVTVRYRLALAGANETVAFERLRANITANASQYRARFGARMSRVVASAGAATGRDMRVRNRTVNATRRGTTGVVTYSFVWTRFGATAGERILVGDALEGFYLENGTRLTVAWPAGYEPTAIRPSPDERRTNSAAWSAPASFGGNQPFLELAPADATTTGRNSSNTPNESDTPNASGGAGERSTTGASGSATAVAGSSPAVNESDTAADGSNTGTEGGSDTGAEGGSDIGPLLTVAAVGVVLGALVPVAWLLRRRRDDGDRSKTDEPTAASTGTDDIESADPAPADGSQEELLSNQERVVRVLERAGGRAKQQHVVEELGWTEAKTSQVVSDLREEGTITGFRLGRENVLAIPDGDSEDSEDDENTAG